MHAGKPCGIHGRSCDEFLPWREKGKGNLIGQGALSGTFFTVTGTQRTEGTAHQKPGKDTIQTQEGTYHHIHELDCVQFPMGAVLKQ